MKLSSLFILFSVLTLTTNAQSLKVSATASTSGNATSEFTVGGENVRVNNSGLIFGNRQVLAASAALSANGLAVTVSSGVNIYDGGEKISGVGYEQKGDDSSLKIYAAGDGTYIIRENIANFLIFDTFGKIKRSVSNSSQSEEGESVSGLAADPRFKTVVLYNPKIIRNGVAGSRMKLVEDNGGASDFYTSSNRVIRTVKISENGQFVAAVTYRDGTDDSVIIFDRFGNRLNKVSFDREIKGIQLSDDGRYLTLYSDGRAAAYSVMNGERLGSTSVRGSLIWFAEYISRDETIVLLAGDMKNNVLTNVEFKAVNLDARKIASADYSRSLGITDMIPLSLDRKGKFNYTLSGLSQSLDIRASF
ncbi:MAG: hypothetical protein FH748_13130 [Balneolaceae bacterium]|nr:hypothetical protein [Balneolaceae bacterium]